MMDYKNLELRILAQLEEEGLINDPHLERAAREAGIPVEDVTPEQRDAAKHLNFLELYGSTGRIR